VSGMYHSNSRKRIFNIRHVISKYVFTLFVRNLFWVRLPYIHTYIPFTLYPWRGSRGWGSQIFLWDTHVLTKFVSYEEHCRRDRWYGLTTCHVSVLLQSISVVNAINPLVAFYDINRGNREVIFFYFVPDTTRDSIL
jgi:hypothetical protein